MSWKSQTNSIEAPTHLNNNSVEEKLDFEWICEILVTLQMQEKMIT